MLDPDPHKTDADPKRCFKWFRANLLRYTGTGAGILLAIWEVGTGTQANFLVIFLFFCRLSVKTIRI
jgi:hypothetical protein